MQYETGSIRQVHRRLLDEGVHISERALRSWIRQGLIPAAYSGRKAYITFGNVMRLIEEGTPMEPDIAEGAGVRRIS